MIASITNQMSNNGNDNRKQRQMVEGIALEEFCAGFDALSLQIHPGWPKLCLSYQSDIGLAQVLVESSRILELKSSDLSRLLSGIESGVLDFGTSIRINISPNIPVFQVLQALGKLRILTELDISEFEYRFRNKGRGPQILSANDLSEFCEQAFPQLRMLSCSVQEALQGDEEDFCRLSRALRKCHNLRRVEFGLHVFWPGYSPPIPRTLYVQSALDFTSNPIWDRFLRALLTDHPDMQYLFLGGFLDPRVALSLETSRLLLGMMERETTEYFMMDCTPSFSELSHVTKYCALAVKHALSCNDDGRWLFRFKAAGSTGILDDNHANDDDGSFADNFIARHGGSAEFSIAIKSVGRDTSIWSGFDRVFCIRLSNGLVDSEAIQSALRIELRHFRPADYTGVPYDFSLARDVEPNHDMLELEDQIRIPNPRALDLTRQFQKARLWDFDPTTSPKDQWFRMLSVLGSVDLTLLFDLIVRYPGECMGLLH